MSLSLYQKKRRFNETPEPQGKERSSRSGLRFVVQKHDASHVHYDFRLEMEGVLKSWAVPKGPSLRPADKRLAMMVEDHPYDYRNFEGVIPAGNYGGGTVIVWDEGTYELAGAEGMSRKEQERELLHQWHAGNIRIVLNGQKLNGEFALFQMKGRGERAWILVKKNDDFASQKDVTEDERSAKSGRTLEEVAAANGATLNHPDEKKKGRKEPPIQLLDDQPKKAPSKKTATKKTATKKAPAKKATAKKTATRTNTGKAPAKAAAKKTAAGKKKAIEGLAAEYEALAPEADMPHDLVPMLATLTDEPFDNDQWLFEIKWDGYRAVAYAQGDNVELESRNLAPFTEKYAPVTEALRALGLDAVLDGEIVAVNDKGLAVFQYLQNWQNTPVHLQYFVFDLMWLNGRDVTHLPLIERKRLLRSILPEEHEVIKYSDHVVGKGKDFFDVALKQGLEGMMAKRCSSIYTAGSRTDEWLKVKVNQRQEVVIAGYTEPRNTRKFFGSLLLGLYEGDQLVYIGHTGSGFNTKSLESIYKKLQPLVTDECPFERCPKGNMPVTWVKPKLVCEIKFTEWTKDRIARHPIFMGLRVDKKAKDVVFEKKISMKKTPAKKTATKKTATKAATKTAPAKKAAAPKAAKAPAKKEAKPPAKKASSKRAPATVDLSAGKDQELTLNGHTLQLTNLDKLYWKKEKFSKGDMINYYLQAAPYILPYLLDRPQSLNRYPNGIDGPNFYQKDMKGKAPGWMKTHTDFSESTDQNVEYLVCTNEATLIYMANLGCIEMHPWHSRTGSWERPDWCLIDLDPDKTNTFDQVMDVALKVKEVLDGIGAKAYCKTSGSTGIHICIPLGAQYDYDQSKQLAELVVTLVNGELHELTSMERSPAKRKGRIYLDYLQNRETQTAAAPYSLRPKPGMPVSTPLDWSELKKGLKPTTYNALNIFDRLRTEGDLFKPVLGKGIDLQKVLAKLGAQI